MLKHSYTGMRISVYVFCRFVGGVTQTNNKITRNNVVTDPNLNTLASEIADHHSVPYEVVLHSIHRGIAYLKYQNGQDIEYEGCPDIIEY